MANNIDNSEEIILGSGELYLAEFDGETIPEDAVIETEANRAGNIKGGAKLEYSISSQTVKSDNGRVTKTIITEETVKLITGLITWVKMWIQALIATARVDESKAGHRIFKIGGLGNQNKKRYLYRFVHTRDDGRKLRLTVTGKNVGTISIAFDPENPTTVDAEIAADALDSEGTLVILDDEIDVAEAAQADAGEDEAAAGE